MKRGERGTVLPLVLISVMLMTLAGMSYLYVTGMRNKMAANALTGRKLQAIAEGGLWYGVRAFAQDPSRREILPKITLGGGTATVQILDVEKGVAGVQSLATLGTHSRMALCLLAPGFAERAIRISCNSASWPGTCIIRSLGEENYGDSWLWGVGSYASNEHRVLIRFPLDEIPAGSTVVSAELNLRYAGMSGFGPLYCKPYRITESWKEGTGGSNPPVDGATWEDRRLEEEWDDEGGTYDSAPDLSKVRFTPQDHEDEYVAWDITALVAGWIDDEYPNHGLIIRAYPRHYSDLAIFYSDDNEDSSAPYLDVTYQVPVHHFCWFRRP